MQKVRLSLAIVLHRECRIELLRNWILLPRGPDTAQTVEAQGILFGALSIAHAKQRQVEKYY
jgi:hypothetical protein